LLFLLNIILVNFHRGIRERLEAENGDAWGLLVANALSREETSRNTTCAAGPVLRNLRKGGTGRGISSGMSSSFVFGLFDLYELEAPRRRLTSHLGLL